MEDVKKWLGKGNAIGLDIWNNKYRYNNETLTQWLDRVSGGNQELRQLISNRILLLAGRTLSNRGTGKDASFSNCYSHGYIGDGLEEIMDAAKNIAMTYKAQGGQGLSLSKIRPKGASIAGQFESDGIIPFMEIFNEVTKGIQQGGCINENDKVLTKRGYIPIKNIVIGDYAWTKKGWVKVNHIFDKGIQKTYKVTTSKGYIINTTIGHKFAIDAFNTKPLSELDIGDNVNLITCNDSELSNDSVKLNDGTLLNEDIAYFLAYLNSNGWISDELNAGTLTMNFYQDEILNKLSLIIQKMGFKTYVSEEKENSYKRLYLNKEIIDWLVKNNLVKNKTKDIRIPDEIFVSNLKVIEAYISGAIDSDGSIYPNSLKYTTISKEYANEFMLLLQILGYFPSIYCAIKDGKQDLFEIRDSFRSKQIKLTSSIKFNDNYKGLVKNSKYSTPYTLNNLGLTAKETNITRLSKISYNNNIGLYSYDMLKDQKFAPIIYDSITEIEDIGETHVYDISLEEEHLFMCNGIYVSNSRKGALLMSLSCNHKEIKDFITIKSEEGKIEKANLSVEVDDQFMEAVDKYYKTGEIIELFFHKIYGGKELSYSLKPIEIYKLMMERAHDWAEPGVIYTNRFRNYNLMQLIEEYQVETANPCGK